MLKRKSAPTTIKTVEESVYLSFVAYFDSLGSCCSTASSVYVKSEACPGLFHYFVPCWKSQTNSVSSVFYSSTQISVCEILWNFLSWLGKKYVFKWTKIEDQETGKNAVKGRDCLSDSWKISNSVRVKCNHVAKGRVAEILIMKLRNTRGIRGLSAVYPCSRGFSLVGARGKGKYAQNELEAEKCDRSNPVFAF